jgi:hypothetical protein
MNLRITLCLLLMPGLACLVVGCNSQPSKSSFETKYDHVKLGMTEEQVITILGQGREVKAREIAVYAESPKLQPKDYPADTKWMQWDGEMQYILVGLSSGKVIVARLVGAQPPVR